MTASCLPESLIDLLTLYLEQHTLKPMVLDPNHLGYRLTPLGALEPVKVNTDMSLDDLLGIDAQKSKLCANTEQYLAGLPANHALLTGARGAGKSSLIRALLSAYHNQGLRLIEINQQQLHWLPQVRQAVNLASKDHGHRYIVYCDDLAFAAPDASYQALKTILEGALDSSDAVLIYATSNRKHLTPQHMHLNQAALEASTEINPKEGIDDSTALADRFGLWLSFWPMPQDAYLDIVAHRLAQHSLNYTDDVRIHALRWASARGGRSGRVATQFATHWIGQSLLEKHQSTFKSKS